MASDSDIAFIRSAAVKAGHYGADRKRWLDWHEVVSTRGLTLPEVLPQLRRDSLRWLSKFYFAEGKLSEGISAYSGLVDANWSVLRTGEPVSAWSIERSFDERQSPAWIYPHEAIDYLVAVARLSGTVASIACSKTITDFDPLGYPSIQLKVASMEIELGRIADAKLRVEPIVRRFHSDAVVHEAYARILARAGNLEEACFHFRAAAKRGVVSTDADTMAIAGLAGIELQTIREKYALPDMDTLEAQFVRQPGMTLLPANSSNEEVHTYGGGSIEMPLCPMCDHKLTLLAEIDVSDAALREPSLASLSGRFSRLPIVHCDRCQLMFSCPDFKLTKDGGQVLLYGPTISRVGNSVFKERGPLKCQPAKLLQVEAADGGAISEAFEIDRLRDRGPQIGGMPRPINQPRRRFCPECDQEQLFYAAFCSSDAFETPAVTNPDGYTYYFVCSDCRIISTDLDNT